MSKEELKKLSEDIKKLTPEGKRIIRKISEMLDATEEILNIFLDNDAD